MRDVGTKEGLHLGLGGAGILWDETKEAEYVNYIIDRAVQGEVKKITVRAHQGCGAAKLYLTGKGETDLTDGQVNIAATEFTQNLTAAIAAEIAQRLIINISVESIFLTTSQMQGPSSFHNAVGIAIDLRVILIQLDVAISRAKIYHLCLI